MPKSLLSTKLSIPPSRPILVHRRRLTERLDSGRYRKLTLISAPAGFGKTTLIIDWLTSTKRNFKTAWFSIDESDNDPSRFLIYLITSLNDAEGIRKKYGRGALEMLQSLQLPSTEAVITSFINEIAAVDANIVVVLDDFHLISDQTILEAVSFLIEFLPKNLHLVISTREDPQISLSRLRARDQLTDIRAIDLRFTSNESEEFLNRVMGLKLSLDDIEALETRTEGWIAGLQLAAISLQGHDDINHLINSFTGSHRLVLDYLMEEVFKKQSKGTQDFLLKTAILDRLSGSLCEAVTDMKDSRQILLKLETANMFIIPLDEIRHWYRYHHLFADLLNQRLRSTNCINVTELHIRARDWYADHGLEREAIRHSLIAKDFRYAAELINNLSMEIVQNGEYRTVANWINALPVEIQQDHPYLWALEVWALRMEGSFEAAEKKMAEIEDAFDSMPDTENFNLSTVKGLINSHKAYLAFVRGNLDEAVFISKVSLSQLPDNMIVIRTLTLLYLGLSLRFKGKLKESLAVYRDALLYGKQLVGSSIAVFCYLHLSDLYYDLGQLQKSFDMAEDAIQSTLYHTDGLVPPFLGYAYICIGRILRQWGRLSEALDKMQTGINLCYQWNVADVIAKGNNELADLYFSLGEKESSQEALQESHLIYQGFSQWASGLVSAHQVKHNLGFGELGDANLWMQGLNIELGNRIDLSRDSEYLTLARIYISQNRFEESLLVLEKINKASQKAEKITTFLESLILQAQVFFLLKSEDMAAEKLQQSLAIGLEKGYVQIFVDEGLEMKTLLESFKSNDIRIMNYVDALLAAFNAKETIVSPSQTLIDPLSEREIEVLELISKGLTNQEIGNMLFITLNTVKAHTRNIFSKLAVNNRTQAVAQARSLRILVGD